MTQTSENVCVVSIGRYWYANIRNCLLANESVGGAQTSQMSEL